MGGFDPIYDCDETEGLSEKERQTLRQAVLRQLNTSPQVRKLLRRKTLAVFKQLTSKKRKALRRRK
jgi:hypothetical protein